MTRPAGPIVTLGASCSACPHERPIADRSECHEPLTVALHGAPVELPASLDTPRSCPLLPAAIQRAQEARWR